MSEETKRDLAGDGVFAAAMRAIAVVDNPEASSVYLGDPDAVEALLRSFLADVLESFGTDAGTPEAEAAAADVDKALRKLTEIFLGADAKRHIPIHGWHEPGRVDAAAVGLGLASADQDAVGRMNQLFFSLHESFAELVNMANTEGVHDEQWEWQIQAEIGTYRDILLGTFESPETVMDAAEDGNVSIPEAVDAYGGLSRTQRALLESFEEYP